MNRRNRNRHTDAENKVMVAEVKGRWGKFKQKIRKLKRKSRDLSWERWLAQSRVAFGRECLDPHHPAWLGAPAAKGQGGVFSIH